MSLSRHFDLRSRARKLRVRTSLLLALSACGGGGDSSGPPPPDTTPRVTAVSVSPGTHTMVVDGQQQFTANVTAVNGASTAVTWSTSNAAIATVSGTGLVQAVTAGSVTITATSSFDATKSGTASVTVNPKPAVNSVSIAPAAPAVTVGGTLALTATVNVVGGASTAVTWSTSNASIVSVSPTGTITGVAVGNANVTATSVADNTKSATVPVVVNPAAPSSVVSVSVAPATLNVSVGGSGQLNATVTVTGGASQAVTWSSANTSVATVDQTGRVTGVAAGSANIRAIAQADNTKFADASVTVTAPSFPSSAEVDATINNLFSPTSVDIQRGGTVTWNFAAVAHNVTFNPATGAPADIQALMSTSANRSFNTAGTFDYQCTLHGGMTGRVIVH